MHNEIPPIEAYENAPEFQGVFFEDENGDLWCDQPENLEV